MQEGQQSNVKSKWARFLERGAHRPPAASWAVAGLLVALAVQLTAAAAYNSASWDEPAHVYAGWLQWTRGCYTVNPPLTRYLLAAPLLGMQLKEPPIHDRPVRVHEVKGGRDFVFQNDADAILFRSRMVVVTLAMLTALLVFLATRRMFGTGAGLIALALLAFDPTLLAHSSLATTDTGQSLFMFWAVYAFYCYQMRPTIWRLFAVAVIVGLAVAAKTSALLLFPILALLAAVELAWGDKLGTDHPDEPTRDEPTRRKALRLATALGVTGVVSFAVLWASFGFRYAPAGGLALAPPMQEQLSLVPSPLQAKLLGEADRLHLLPQAYTHGVAQTLHEARAFTSYVLGTIYPSAVWFFFPVAMAIKSSLSFLILLGIGAWAVFAGRVRERREILYLVIPAAVYLASAMTGGMNIGVRHVLPVYVFLTAAIAGAAWALVRYRRRWLAVVAVLLVFQAVSVLRTFPAYIAYANELFGGPAQVHRHLSDSSSDWGQQLKAVKRYLDGRGARNCWFAYFGQSPVDYRYYGIPCKPLITADSLFLDEARDVPAAIDGPVLMSAGLLSGFEFGPSPLNPYEQFKTLEPVHVIDHGVFVFDGHFEIPLAAALSHLQKARTLLESNDPHAALGEAQRAQALAPESAAVLWMVGLALEANHAPDQAADYYRKALAIAEATHAAFERGLIADLRRRLGSKPR